MWSLGVIVYIMLSGDPPFSGDCGITCGWREGKPCEECAENLLEEIQAGYFDFAAPAWRRVSGAAKDLIARMLVRADERITASQALQHPWLRHQEEAPQTPLLTPKRLSSAPAGPAALTEFAAEANVKNRQLGSMDETQLQFMKSGVAFLDDGSGGGDCGEKSVTTNHFLPLDGGRRQRATASMGLFVGGVDDLATDTKDTETTIFKNASSPCSSAATTMTTMTTSATTTLTTTTTGKASEITSSNNLNNVLTDRDVRTRHAAEGAGGERSDESKHLTSSVNPTTTTATTTPSNSIRVGMPAGQLYRRRRELIAPQFSHLKDLSLKGR